MQPPENRPAIRLHDAETTTWEAVPAPAVQRASTAPLVTPVPSKLARMLLPGEHVTFGSTPHPVVFVAPFAFAAAIGVALETALNWEVRHNGLLAPLLTGVWRQGAVVVALALLAATGAMLVKRTLRFAGLRVVSTNRRIFAIRGVIVRRITPLGNTALAASTISQGIFGRMFGYGSIHLPLADGTPGTFRDMRDALQLYREFQAVANGVDGDEWKPAVRQTIIP
jgi:Bacterial PH domain